MRPKRIPGAAPALQCIARAGFQPSDVRTTEAQEAVANGLNAGTLTLVTVGKPPQVWILPTPEPST